MQSELDEIKKDNMGDAAKSSLTQEMLSEVVDKSFRDVDQAFLDDAAENLDMDGTTANVAIFWEDRYSK